MTRVATPDNEDYLLSIARHGTAYHIERFVAQYRRIEKLRHPEAADALYRAREATYYYDDDGCVVLKAKLPPDQGELVVKALEMAMEMQDVDPEERTPIAMRRALITRDGGCRFPGCTNQRFCDGHHIKHWTNGGETNLDNLVMLCRHHHRLVHEGGFDCVKDEHGKMHFLDRRRRRLQEFATAPAVTIEKSLAWLYRRFENQGIDSQSCAAKWYAGDRMDWDNAMFVAFT